MKKGSKLHRISPLDLLEKGDSLDKENASFAVFLCSVHPDALDKEIMSISSEVYGMYDCTQCANCCSRLEPEFCEEDVQRIAAAQNRDPEQFKIDFMALDVEGFMYMYASPCPFLENKQCACYAIKPQSCSDYPFLHLPGNAMAIQRLMENAKICPMVFSTVEYLKKIYGFLEAPN